MFYKNKIEPTTEIKINTLLNIQLGLKYGTILIKDSPKASIISKVILSIKLGKLTGYFFIVGINNKGSSQDITIDVRAI